MYRTDDILDKINNVNTPKARSLSASDPQITLADIMVRSFSEVKDLAGDSLSWGETNYLYQQAQTALKENKLLESRILSLANPQLTKAVNLGLRQSSLLKDYDSVFPQRSSKFVKPGSVASMFSPAGYLTELYREARDMHPVGSEYHLDTRRPDLALLSLSQKNMDDELSTLALSSEMLMHNIQQQDDQGYEEVLENLSTWRHSGMTPFHLPYEATRQSILLQDETFTAFRRNPEVAKLMDTSSLLGLEADISPDLFAILTEEVTESNAAALIKKNFGEIDADYFQDFQFLAKYYGISHEEMTLFLDVLNERNGYVDNVLNSYVVDDAGMLQRYRITRVKGDNYSAQTEFIDLFNVSKNRFYIRVKFKADYGQVSVKMDSPRKDVYFCRINGPTKANVTYQSSEFILTDDDLAGQFGLYLFRYGNKDSDTKISSRAKFRFEHASSGAEPGQVGGRLTNILLLKLNKLIRLHKATGISPADIRIIVENSSNTFDITSKVLCELFWVHYYRTRYQTTLSASLVLSGAEINQISSRNQVSAFTQLFNSPPLNGHFFSADGESVALEPSAVIDTFRTGVMKGAFQVNDTELYTLWLLARGSAMSASFTATVANLSAIYRVKLLADVHELSVTELAALLSISPFASVPIATLSGTDLTSLVSFIGLYSEWLREQNLSVSDLWLMTTTRYSTALSPDIENLLTTLKNGLSGQDFSDWNTRTLALAPFVAAATQLDSAETAHWLLVWINNLQPQKLTLSAFLTLILKDNRTAAETEKMVGFCQVLGQLALTVSTLKLTTGELSLAVMTPAKFQYDDSVTNLPHTLATVRGLARLHNGLQRCGASATEVLFALGNGDLTPARLAQAMMLDEQLVTQGLARHNSAAQVFSSWNDIDVTLQWVDMSTSLGITPAGVARLMNLKYTTAENPPVYKEWTAVGHILQSGLNAWQKAQLQVTLDERLSAALSAYAIKHISPSWVTDRDKLYSWLLIDNKISAKIKTTRLAEAIASVQLYINRSLVGLEEGATNLVKSRPFFGDWDLWNKRYSTWAGVSQLVYYPENYIDPTLRIGQTGMMDEMLQSLSQSQLSSDTVENGFKTYMTRFEEIANLKVIGGYHDAVTDQYGLTYIIGRSASGEYYWRSADIGKLANGTLPANAWSEWTKISAAISAVNDLVRPVIFQSRLHICWVESREGSTTNGSTTNRTIEYQLKYAHILHDGTWSVPVPVTPAQAILPPPNTSINDVGMYCGCDTDKERLYLFFHKKFASYGATLSNISGVRIFANGDVEELAQTTARDLALPVASQLSTTSSVLLNSRYNGVEIGLSAAEEISFKWGDFEYSIMNGGSVSAISAVLTDDGKVALTVNATAKVNYNGNGYNRSRTLVDMMKHLGQMGDEFYLPQSMSVGNYASAQKYTLECVIKRKNKGVYFKTSSPYTLGTLVPHFWPGSLIPRPQMPGIPTTKMDESYWTATVDSLPHPPELISVCRSNPFPSAGPDFSFKNFQYINTTINYTDVKLAVTGGVAVNFSSDECSKYTFSESLFLFKNKNIEVPLSAFINNTVDVMLTLSASAPAGDGRSLGEQVFRIRLTRTLNTLPVITLNQTSTSAQYLQYGVYRIRVNTLFAKQLVARANIGLDTVLSMVTQQLQEPQLGKGYYVDFTLPRYSASVHGSSRSFSLSLKHVVDSSPHVIYTGLLTDTEQSVRLFVPLDAEPLNSNYCARVFLTTGKTGDTSWKGPHFQYTDKTQTALKINPSSDLSMFTRVVILDAQTEPMDFNGANALYFWEMFYYVPMMVFKRLLQESRFTEATQWIKYVWSPEGYLLDGQPATWQWNVRPLEDDVSWNASPLDAVDPDAVAQADPMHYKVATFMSWIDLLIARGDAAYRQLERDTLNEAKMWYVQALNVLGDEPWLTQSNDWGNPLLEDAAGKTLQTRTQQAMEAVRLQTEVAKFFTANSLTALFLPQQNDKLIGYWRTLEQRLYNLRHHLSIDGQPLSLAIYAPAIDPASLLSAAVNASQRGSSLPAAVMPMYRFPIMLESARGMVNQLTQFGSSLLSISERQDAEALSELLQTQGAELMRQSLALQQKNIAEIDADQVGLEESLQGAYSRFNHYSERYEEDINRGESQVLDLALTASVLSTTAAVSYTVAAGLDAVPNIFGVAFGGSRYGSIARAVGTGIEIGASATRAAAERIGQSEAYRRRRQEWELQRNTAETEIKQIEAQLNAMAIRREAAVLQKTFLETQQSQTRAQMAFLQNKFTNKALYNWMRGKLAAIYYQFYDLTVSRCLMAQEAWKWTMNTKTATFIRPGIWQGRYAGLMAGETLQLSLAQMEQHYLQADEREKEVTRTVCLSEVYDGLAGKEAFALSEAVTTLVTAGKGSAGTDSNGLVVTSDKQLRAALKLSDLKIGKDYPDTIGKTRRIKQVSVTLPALTGPYQDVRAVLSYGGSVVLPRGCDALAVSSGMNDSGQFQLDFNDNRWLPFEGIPVDDTGTLFLSFPDIGDRQKALLLSLTDIILHIRYTIIG